MSLPGFPYPPLSICLGGPPSGCPAGHPGPSRRTDRAHSPGDPEFAPEQPFKNSAKHPPLVGRAGKPPQPRDFDSLCLLRPAPPARGPEISEEGQACGTTCPPGPESRLLLGNQERPSFSRGPGPTPACDLHQSTLPGPQAKHFLHGAKGDPASGHQDRPCMPKGARALTDQQGPTGRTTQSPLSRAVYLLGLQGPIPDFLHGPPGPGFAPL